MAKKTMSVEAFLRELEHPRKAEIERVRALVLGAHEGISERIKWNAPSFCVGGDDRVTFKLHPPDRVQLVLHRGAKAKDAGGFTFDDDTGLVRWVAKDRGLVELASMDEVEARGSDVARLVRRWLEATA